MQVLLNLYKFLNCVQIITHKSGFEKMQWKYPSLSKLTLQKLSLSEYRDLHSPKELLSERLGAEKHWQHGEGQHPWAKGPSWAALSLKCTSPAKFPPQKMLWGFTQTLWKICGSLCSLLCHHQKIRIDFSKLVGSFTKEAAFSFLELL